MLGRYSFNPRDSQNLTSLSRYLGFMKIGWIGISMSSMAYTARWHTGRVKPKEKQGKRSRELPYCWRLSANARRRPVSDPYLQINAWLKATRHKLTSQFNVGFINCSLMHEDAWVCCHKVSLPADIIVKFFFQRRKVAPEITWNITFREKSPHHDFHSLQWTSFSPNNKISWINHFSTAAVC